MTTPDCEHEMTVISVEESDRKGQRVVHMMCEKCGYSLDKYTTKTDEQIAAEMGPQ